MSRVDSSVCESFFSKLMCTKSLGVFRPLSEIASSNSVACLSLSVPKNIIVTGSGVAILLIRCCVRSATVKPASAMSLRRHWAAAVAKWLATESVIVVAIVS
ncbi:MAG TPA: hypothetical protein EYN86_00550 [Planctomycetes bacterium]|nr:hypothetical protein [Planctomycetota bacterium]